METKKDHKDCWHNQYDQNDQHMEYVSPNIYYHMMIIDSIIYLLCLQSNLKGEMTIW